MDHGGSRRAGEAPQFSFKAIAPSSVRRVVLAAASACVHRAGTATPKQRAA